MRANHSADAKRMTITDIVVSSVITENEIKIIQNMKNKNSAEHFVNNTNVWKMAPVRLISASMNSSFDFSRGSESPPGRSSRARLVGTLPSYNNIVQYICPQIVNES